MNKPPLTALQAQTGQIYRKHLLALRDYWTPAKVLNLLLCEVEKRRRVPNPRSMPYAAVIDVTNACNLRCPGCPSGSGIFGRPKSMLDLGTLDKFLDEMAPHLLIASLYNWGESLLHPQVSEIVRRVHDRRIFTSISSNLNLQDGSRLDAVCDAGLDHLVISADGATPESYRRYRVGGDFDLLVRNIRHLVSYKKVKGLDRPILEWQVLAFNYLEPELVQAQALAQELGVDWFNVKGPTAPDRLQSDTAKLQGAFYGGQKACALLWHTIVLQADGGIAPCCNLYHREDDFGHIEHSSISEVRMNGRYTTARMLFDPRRTDELAPGLDHPCIRCPVVHRQGHLANYLKANPHAFTAAGFMGILAERSEEDRTWLGL